MEITYELIKPVVLEETLENFIIKCKFQVEGEIFEADGNIRRDTKDTAQRIQNTARSTIVGRVRSAFSRLLYKVVGGGMAGSIASMAGSEMSRDALSPNSFSRKEKEGAVIDAFKKIQNNLHFDEANKVWKIARQFSEFERRLKNAPISKSYDKKTLARMLVEMSRADGSIATEEKEFFQDFLTEETGSFVELMRQPALSRVECEEVTKEAKENVFMIVTAVAIADHSFDANEKSRLEEYGNMMGLTADKQKELIRFAQDYTIEVAIREGDQFSRDELYKFADQIGMDRGEAERAQIRMSKRINN